MAIDEETNDKIIDLYFNQPKTIPDIVKIIALSPNSNYLAGIRPFILLDDSGNNIIVIEKKVM